jgi:hypothetical protein
VKRYVLREYGSWGVLVLSYAAGLSVSAGFRPGVIAGFVALALSVNSKQALTFLLRSGATDFREYLAVFLAQILTASVILILLMRADLPRFFPLAAVPLTYLCLLRFAGEHAFLTEIAGFSLLSMASLISRYTISGEIDLRLYTAVAVFFASGVFKVRAKFKRGACERLSAAFYVLASAGAYYLMRIPLIVLLPLADNLIFSATLYRVKLKTAGWIEVVKGTAFVVLLTLNGR